MRAHVSGRLVAPVVAGALVMLIMVAVVIANPREDPAGTTQATESARATSTSTAHDATPSATGKPVATPTKDLSVRPQIWFAPLDPSRPDASRPFNGGPDFFALFEEDAPWERAAEALHVFKIYGGWVAGQATDAELRRVVGDLNRRGIAIGFEAGPLLPDGTCDAWIDEGVRIVRRLQAAGADVRFVAFDHPYDAGVLSAEPGACRVTPEKAAASAAAYADALRRTFPEIRVGSIETAANDAAHVERWVEAYRSAAGVDFDFIHLDLNFARPDWPEATLEIEALLRSRGIEFGMIYFGNWEDTADSVWLRRVEERFTAYELLGGRPDHAVFQSWHPRPQDLLPETDGSAFTAIINRYLRPRTTLTLELGSAGLGVALAEGALTSQDGVPVANASVQVSEVALAGRGVWHEYTVAGIVPPSAVVADVGFRVNTECACAGDADLTLGSVMYHDDGQAEGLVLDPRRGPAEWATWGSAAWQLGPDGLEVVAAESETAATNSPRFAVTGGTAYSVTFRARVAPASLGSGYFSIIFSDGRSEITRELIPLAGAVLSIGTVQTDAQGRYRVEVPTARARGEFAIRVSYAGTDERWPARAQRSVP